jgi:phosphatidylserine/phosphatidylglycerophosphate/cardiolipin synthase-like enzyme
VIEYHERQHDEAVELFDRRQTVSGVSRGEQRRRYDECRSIEVPARERVMLVSFAAFTLGRLAADLAAAVKRGCVVNVLFETEDDSSGAYAGTQSVPFGSVAGITRWRWPSDQREFGALLHAKVLVVDGRRALVGSAKLTHRALTANLEAGALVEDRTVAEQLERHVLRLVERGIVVRE